MGDQVMLLFHRDQYSAAGIIRAPAALGGMESASGYLQRLWAQPLRGASPSAKKSESEHRLARGRVTPYQLRVLSETANQLTRDRQHTPAPTAGTGPRDRKSRPRWRKLMKGDPAHLRAREEMTGRDRSQATASWSHLTKVVGKRMNRGRRRTR